MGADNRPLDKMVLLEQDHHQAHLHHFFDGSSGSITASTRLSEGVSSAGLEANHSKYALVHSEIKAIANNDSGNIKRGEVIGPVQREFEMDPANKFWKWNTETQNWFHKDECTGFVLWAPKQLD
ncbi:hypothetical protein CGLO_10507 [Colletotrichum gloeosporioides Cg-14]|uniref:Uncharacterized protein n=1 Tax=Colletotrichum gloeosporioides (strain Cg-14) TaxID=1237896 RepID=T0LEU9_COLGC|nr:hypothetical protein CGLO_10507 [Colletotrichum gloeosporioides Cg-14]